jgi:hypothetical protein
LELETSNSLFSNVVYSGILNLSSNIVYSTTFDFLLLLLSVVLFQLYLFPLGIQ